MRGEKITKPCDNCGTLTTKLLSKIRPDSKGFYCGHTCSHKATWANGLRKPQEKTALRETRPCDNCGKPTEKELSQVAKSGRWFCSTNCTASYTGRERAKRNELKLNNQPNGKKSYGNTDTTNCKQCAKSFKRDGYAITINREFCSRICSSDYQGRNRITKTCEHCNKEFTVSQSKKDLKCCSMKCQMENKTKRPLGRFHNGREARLNADGYVFVWEPEHPNKSNKGWQFEHRLVVEKRIGRYLNSDEAVHHINHKKSDNRSENLELMNAKEHAILSVRDYREEIADKLKRLEEYEKLFGPLPE